MKQRSNIIRMIIDSQLFVFLIVISTGLGNASCPSSCSCSIHSSGTYVNCESKSLGNIPELSDDTYYLTLNYNNITEIAVHFCKVVPLLQHLHVYGNQISEIKENTFDDCDQLKILDLGNNLIESIQPTTFRNLTSLNSLYLYSNEISTIEPFTFVNLPSLQILYLYNNKIRSLESNTFINMTNLLQLLLHKNEISTISSFTCMNLPSLQYLQLHYNEISTIESFSFTNLPSLRYLYLFNNKIRLLRSHTFINMTNLNYIDLSGNNITHIEDHAFVNLTSLSLLHLTDNPLNCDCSIFSFWLWLIERASIGTSAKCSNGTLVTSLQSAALETCNPDNCKCFNGGKCVAMGNELVCDCIGQWTGEFCQESQCITYECGFGDCYIEPVNGTAQCLCGERYVNYCPGTLCYV
ncbi:slit homolog 1 protein-like isoform X8 [Mytilus californianus]|uniref:slit homolog 1 protein-like isoform X8 n=1 Tax=Mytilus californianus TaxID=6549 RepID=UPI0022484131|nr:slit homolog 1 protein-like isoform X8 [Mytilus californianus]